MNKYRFLIYLLLLGPLCHAGAVCAARFAAPEDGNDLIGELRQVTADRELTLLDIAREHDVGQDELQIANPSLDRWLPASGDQVLIPSQHVLPDAKRRGLVLNLPEMRLYHFPRDRRDGGRHLSGQYRTDGLEDPTGRNPIIRKQAKPSWVPPQSVHQEAAAAGETLPKVVPPGPDNPLGDYALRLGLPGYLIHGTNRPYGVGMRVTHGCVRMLPEDIEQLFGQVRVGTGVQILNQPVKTGWQDGILYIEVHPPLEEDPTSTGDLLRFTLERIYEELAERPAVLNGQAVREAVEEMRGVPVASPKEGSLDARSAIQRFANRLLVHRLLEHPVDFGLSLFRLGLGTRGSRHGGIRARLGGGRISGRLFGDCTHRINLRTQLLSVAQPTSNPPTATTTRPFVTLFSSFSPLVGVC